MVSLPHFLLRIFPMNDLLLVTDDNLTAMLENDRPVILAIGADWCPDCVRAAPFFMQFAKRFADKAVFARADSDASPAVKAHFNVVHIPTMVVVKNGQEMDRIVEVKTPGELLAWIEKNL